MSSSWAQSFPKHFHSMTQCFWSPISYHCRVGIRHLSGAKITTQMQPSDALVPYGFHLLSMARWPFVNGFKAHIHRMATSDRSHLSWRFNNDSEQRNRLVTTFPPRITCVGLAPDLLLLAVSILKTSIYVVLWILSSFSGLITAVSQKYPNMILTREPPASVPLLISQGVTLLIIPNVSSLQQREIRPLFFESHPSSWILQA